MNIGMRLMDFFTKSPVAFSWKKKKRKNEINELAWQMDEQANA